MKEEPRLDPICGLWIAPNGTAHICHAKGDARYDVECQFKPFVWSAAAVDDDICDCVKIPLDGPDGAPLDTVLSFYDPDALNRYLKKRDKTLPFYRISSLENQFLLASGLRMFGDMRFDSIRRLQLDIETHSEGSFSNPVKHGDRIIAIGLASDGGYEKLIELKEFSDEAERELLETFCKELVKFDPDIIEGHNIFKFDLDYIARRAAMLGAELKIGRFGAKPSFRKSRIKIAERLFDYTRCDIPGRTVADTLILVQLFDIAAREMPSYSLKEAAIHFGISDPETRTYISGGDIKNIFVSDRKRFRAYLSDDLRETRELAKIMLPAYVAHVHNFALTLQECLLRGNGVKVEQIFLEKYYRAKAKLPEVPPSHFFEGAISESYATGVFKNVLHYDVASLYPSIMLYIGKCPRGDYLQTFLDVLKELREYRLKYKMLARTAKDPAEKREYTARQNSFKILINSFYGYLGLDTARFGDSDLAEEITAKGREILSNLIARFDELGVKILEADTDGIYISAKEYFKRPESLLEKVSDVLPAGIDLEFDGAYPAMLCYKAKNYALIEDGELRLKGSALRSRAMEPYLKGISNAIIEIELGLSKADLSALLLEEKRKIESGEYEIRELAKNEFISMSPAVYKSTVVDSAGKGRRAAMEAALLMEPQPKAGDRVRFYITKSADGKKSADWTRARPLELYDPLIAPYDAEYYVKKLKDICERFSDILKDFNFPDDKPVQGELFDF